MRSGGSTARSWPESIWPIPRLRLGFEGHSRSYHLGERAEHYDEDRDIEAAKVGWELVYLGFAATRFVDQVRRDMEEIAVRRSADLGLAPL